MKKVNLLQESQPAVLLVLVCVRSHIRGTTLRVNNIKNRDYTMLIMCLLRCFDIYRTCNAKEAVFFFAARGGACKSGWQAIPGTLVYDEHLITFLSGRRSGQHIYGAHRSPTVVVYFFTFLLAIVASEAW